MIVGINVVLLTLYFWSRGGATTELRIDAIGSDYRAFVDGELIAEAHFEGRERGGVGIVLPRAGRVPSLPQPSGIDSIRVTDASSGEVIFEDSFDGQPSSIWETVPDDWTISDGVLETAAGGLISTGFRSWGDYVVEAKLRNVTEAVTYVRMEDTRNAVFFKMRPYRHYDTSLTLLEDGDAVDRQGGGGLRLDRGQTIQSMAAMLLRPYPIALLMIVSAVTLAFLLRVSWLERQLQSVGTFIVSTADTIVVVLAAGTFVLLWYMLYVVGDAIPKVPDSVLYVFQSKIFASFNVTADAPPVRESFSIFHPHFLQVVDGRWFSHYQFGHPLFLAVGQLFGAVWLVPPILGAGSVLLIYFVGKRVYGVMAGMIAAVVLMFSPFFQMTASNFMSHNTAVFVILAGLFFLTRPLKRPMLSMFLSGVFLGLLFNMRPLTAVALTPIMGAFLLYELLRAGDERKQVFRETLAFGAGGALMLLAYFGYNLATTGEFLTSPYALQGTFGSNTFGFGGRHTIEIGLQNEQVLLSLMLLVANGWPIAIGLVFVALPFVLGSRNRWDYMLGGAVLSIAAANIFYLNAAVMHGPRFWYETMPFLMLLTGRGAQSLRDESSRVGDWLAGRFDWFASTSTTGITTVAVSGLIAWLVMFSAWGWMLENRTAWPEITFVPRKISELEGFNFTDRRLLDRADELELENALVLVEGPRADEGRCAQWWCYGSVFWTNSPELDGNIVWAERQNNSDDLALLAEYEDRQLYVAAYSSGTIRPVTSGTIIRDVEERMAEEGVEAPTPEPDLSPEERDEVRLADLDTLRQALNTYAEQTGALPDTLGQVQTLCVYRDLDAGCELSTVLTELPTDPLGEPASNGYWYSSDGTTFHLFAIQEGGEPDETLCPENLPPLGGAEHLICVAGPTP